MATDENGKYWPENFRSPEGIAVDKFGRNEAMDMFMALCEREEAARAKADALVNPCALLGQWRGQRYGRAN